MIKRHIVRKRDLFLHLMASGRRNPIILSIIASEMYFRGRIDRLFEYFAWLLMSIIHPERATHITLGIAQIEVSKWIFFGNVRAFRPSLKAVLYFTDPLANYDICDAYLNSNSANYKTSFNQIARYYNGAPRTYYIFVLKQCYEYFLTIETSKIFVKTGS